MRKRRNLLSLFVLSVIFMNNAQTVSTFCGKGTFESIDGSPTQAAFMSPAFICKDPLGNLYVTENSAHKIRKIAPDGNASTIAGNGTFGYVNSVGTNAVLRFPLGIGFYEGSLYFADQGNHVIRKVDASQLVSTFAGPNYGVNSIINGPQGVAVDSYGNVFIAEAAMNRILKVTPSGVITVFAGSTSPGNQDGTGTSASFNTPIALTIDADNFIYVADSYNNMIRKISPDGQVTTIAGSTMAGFVNGTGTNARFNRPRGIAVDNSGNIYISDTENHVIRKINAQNEVTTFAGTGQSGYYNGLYNEARFNFPYGLTIGADGALYVCDGGNHVIRKITTERPRIMVVCPADYTIYPNIADEEITISTAITSSEVLIVNSSGNPVHSQSIGSGQTLINVMGWNPGFYWVKISSAGGLMEYRILVQSYDSNNF